MKLLRKWPKTDFEELLSVIDGSRTPQKVYNFEVIVDEEIKKFVMENLLGLDYFPSVGVNTELLLSSKSL